MIKKKKPHAEKVVICVICGEQFLSRATNAKYCSDKCRDVFPRMARDEYRLSHREEHRQYDKNRYHKIRDERLAYISTYSKTPLGREVARKSRNKYELLHPERRSAISKVNHAITAGKLKRGPCEICGSINDIEGHHDDYSKPMEVRWLCTTHHGEARLPKITKAEVVK